ncbi:hypothetical protein BB934_45140 (plasmid) [Microvirga ossetica]|uniref:Uncharacterized protein n=1 Tax=Microvirga ossetica TaxID=1882682 RepID=A0A1B2EZP9_9HYPH|nr:hypothetical protein [Microvirga ossetica]ANY85407.1 hypothetical protein BB934_45140 [Microvirga ossetica]
MKSFVTATLAAILALGTVSSAGAADRFVYRFQGRGPQVPPPEPFKTGDMGIRLGFSNGLLIECLMAQNVDLEWEGGWQANADSTLGLHIWFAPVYVGSSGITNFQFYAASKSDFTNTDDPIWNAPGGVFNNPGRALNISFGGPTDTIWCQPSPSNHVISYGSFKPLKMFNAADYTDEERGAAWAAFDAAWKAPDRWATITSADVFAIE